MAEDRYPPEISDVVIAYDPQTLARLPVRREDAAAAFSPGSEPWRVVTAMAADDAGVLDGAAVDRTLIGAHNEMQRLWEEFLHGQRVAGVLRVLIDGLRASGHRGRIRVVDVGCGIGYVLRWMASHRVFPTSEVELVGVDYNAALVAYAQRLAEVEGLTQCRFEVGNAFAMDQPGTIIISSGVLHHFRGESLSAFFASQSRCGPEAFAHFDIQRSWLAPVGAWLFHYARMRLPLARHDGTLSAIRAHSAQALFSAAEAGSGGMFRLLHFNRQIPWLPVIRTMHAVIGVRPEVAEALKLDGRYAWSAGR